MNCKKVKYASKEFAELDIKLIQKKSNRRLMPIRSYLCECGTWHITSREDYKEINKDKLILKLKSEVERLNNENSRLKEEAESLRNAKSDIRKGWVDEINGLRNKCKALEFQKYDLEKRIKRQAPITPSPSH